MSLGSSMAVTLPVAWLKTHGLKKGDLLLTKIQLDKTLLLSPVGGVKYEPTELNIYIKAEDKRERIIRGITAGFLNGSKIIKLTSSRVFTVEQQVTIRNIASRYYMMIVESDANSMTLSTLLDDYKTSVILSVERMHIITVSMFNDSLKSMRAPDLDLLRAVISLEDDIDQLKFLILRLIRLAAIDPQMMSQQALDPIDCLDYQTLTHRIERIADHLTNIAQSLIAVNEQGGVIPEEILDHLLEGAESTYRRYEAAVQGFISRDITNVDEIIDGERAMIELFQKITPLPKPSKKEEVPQSDIISIRESIRKISHYTADIAELTIDRTYRN